MKNTTNCLLMVLLAGGLAFAGCGKPASTQVQGTITAMDLPKFQEAFPSPTPAQQSSIDKVRMGVRYGMYPDALAALDKLASDTSLTEPQKKAVSDVIEGIKQTLAKTATAPAK
jgi:hypothetical protein